MNKDFQLIYDSVNKALNVEESLRNCKCFVFFHTSYSKNFIEFLLNEKIIIYENGKMDKDYKFFSINKGIELLYKTELKIMNNFNVLLTQLENVENSDILNYSSLILYLTEKSNITKDNIGFKYIDIGCSLLSHHGNTRQYLIQYLQSEWNKCSVDLNKIPRSMITKLSLQLPCEIGYYSDQIGGHGLIFDDELKFLKFKKLVFKPVQNFPKGRTEILFYEELYGLKSFVNYTALKKFVPKYVGLFFGLSKTEHDLYIGLKDVFYKLHHPNVVDIKLGQITYEPDAAPAKITLERTKYFWREEIGFLFTGIRLHVHDDITEPVFFDRYYGLTLDPEMIYEKGVLLFLSCHSDRQRLAKSFIDKLNSLLQWFEIQKNFNFYSTSLLLAYDSDRQTVECEKIVLKMVDFTHTRVSNQKDSNCIYGLKSLISYFSRIVN